MKVAIHQPEHLPWLGFFHKINMSDIYVVLDNVQFRKNYYQNRNKIRTPLGWQWITVPLRAHCLSTRIKDVLISLDKKWKKKWLNSVYFAYKKSCHFNKFYDDIGETVNQKIDSLCDLNVAFIKLICKFLNIQCKVIMASQLGVRGQREGLLLGICKKLKADTYLSGISGKEYLNLDDFHKENIKVIFQEFHHPIYKQLHEPFLPCMSIIDLLFNYGGKSLDIINGIGVPVLDKLFL